jgi:hypothetical protein
MAVVGGLFASDLLRILSAGVTSQSTSQRQAHQARHIRFQ